MDTSYTWTPSGAGAPPPELVGRGPLLAQTRELLGQVKQKRAEKCLLLTGLRGVGKTVLLNEVARLAEAAGYRTIFMEAHEDKALGPLLARTFAAHSTTSIASQAQA